MLSAQPHLRQIVMLASNAIRSAFGTPISHTYASTDSGSVHTPRATRVCVAVEQSVAVAPSGGVSGICLHAPRFPQNGGRSNGPERSALCAYVQAAPPEVRAIRYWFFSN